MSTIQFEVGLPVADYSGDFETCSRDLRAARKAAVTELEEYIGLENVRKLSVRLKFVEFDAGNPAHANAIFNVTVSGGNGLISHIKKSPRGV